MLWSKSFWAGTGERAIKTFAQSLLAGLLVTAPIVAQPWLPALGVAVTATVFSILTSIGNASFTAGNQTSDSVEGSSMGSGT